MFRPGQRCECPGDADSSPATCMGMWTPLQLSPDQDQPTGDRIPGSHALMWLKSAQTPSPTQPGLLRDVGLMYIHLILSQLPFHFCPHLSGFQLSLAGW